MTPEDPSTTPTEAAYTGPEGGIEDPTPDPAAATEPAPLETGDERADRLQDELDAIRASAAADDKPDPMDRHPGALTGQDEPQDESHVLGRTEDEEAATVRKFVDEWDTANLDERNVLLAGLGQVLPPVFVDGFRTGTEDHRREALRGLRRSLGIEDDD